MVLSSLCARGRLLSENELTSTKEKVIAVEVLVNTVLASTFLALILTVPSLVIFIVIYFSTGNIALGVLVGFGLHFVGLANSERISKGLLKIMS